MRMRNSKVFFGGKTAVFRVFFGCLTGTPRHPFRLFFGCFQCRAFGTSVGGRRDCNASMDGESHDMTIKFAIEGGFQCTPVRRVPDLPCTVATARYEKEMTQESPKLGVWVTFPFLYPLFFWSISGHGQFSVVQPFSRFRFLVHFPSFTRPPDSQLWNKRRGVPIVAIHHIFPLPTLGPTIIFLRSEACSECSWKC